MSIKIIYIIIGVIWVVSQIVKAKNKSANKTIVKKQPKPQPAYETVERPKTYPTQTEAQSYENESQENMINEMEGDSEIQYQQPQPHLSAAQTYFQQKESELKEELSNETETSPFENLDAKKAILYNELFSKPKWKE